MLVLAALSVATCHDPIPPMKGSIGGYTSTVEGSVVAFYCNEGLIPLGQMNTTCASNGSWTPNPAELICSEPPSDGELSVDSHGTISNMHYFIATRNDSYVCIYIAHTQEGFHGARLAYSLPEATVGSATTCAVQLSKSNRSELPIPYN